MEETKKEIKHPAQYSKEVLEYLSYIIDPKIKRIHDPFAGTGLRLGQFCDEHGIVFSGTDIERWGDIDSRVSHGDATSLASYPKDHFSIVCSPTYPNGISDHFEPKDDSVRRTYRVGLGRALNENNTGRYSLRGGQRSISRYWELCHDAVFIWSLLSTTTNYVNVSDFYHKGQVYDLVNRWCQLLASEFFTVKDVFPVETKRYRYGNNNELRVKNEVWISFE